jgi:hypothetical protein
VLPCLALVSSWLFSHDKPLYAAPHTHEFDVVFSVPSLRQILEHLLAESVPLNENPVDHAQVHVPDSVWTALPPAPQSCAEQLSASSNGGSHVQRGERPPLQAPWPLQRFERHAAAVQLQLEPKRPVAQAAQDVLLELVKVKFVAHVVHVSPEKRLDASQAHPDSTPVQLPLSLQREVLHTDADWAHEAPKRSGSHVHSSPTPVQFPCPLHAEALHWLAVRLQWGPNVKGLLQIRQSSFAVALNIERHSVHPLSRSSLGLVHGAFTEKFTFETVLLAFTPCEVVYESLT